MALAEKEQVTVSRSQTVVEEASAVVDQAMARRTQAKKVVSVIADELDLTQTYGPQAQPPEELKDLALQFMEEYKTSLTDRAELYLQRQKMSRLQERTNAAPQAGQPVINNYVAWDVLTLSPIELGMQPYEYPNKIIRSGKWCLQLAVMWTNPFPSVPDGFAIPPTIQLGGRTVRVSFDQLNLTTATASANAVFTFTMPSPAPALILIPAFFQTATVANPQLLELNVTADVVDPVQPYAAFASWHIDIDREPSWFAGFPPNVPPELVHDVPNRCMIYPVA